MFRQLIKLKSYISFLARSRKYLLPTLRTMATTPSGENRRYNRLSLEKSPYLLQHASNPVNWYPWGSEAFEKAKTERKLIFLSVGYSTCHWCHIMERESFEDEEISAILNDNFVSVKVDREERPDVDQVYMTFIQATTGHGGWPMTVWLTPDLKPIAGGTYFPPDSRYGHPGLKDVLQNIATKWKNDRAAIEGQGSYILNVMEEHSTMSVSSESGMPSNDLPEKCYEILEKDYDREKGGFREAPKFPQPVNLRFLLSVWSQSPDSEQGQRAKEMCKHTLMMMCKGGIWDHIAKGFHRYATDRDWHVPHFEKMLYDQAQLTVAYCEAYQVTKEERFADTARDILKYVNRDLSHKDGGFYSAEDADSKPSHDSLQTKEGAFFVWKEEDIKAVLGDLLPGNSKKTYAELFCYHFNVKPDGNIDPSKDPHGEFRGENILIEVGDNTRTGEQFGLTPIQVEKVLNESKAKLFEVRDQRPKPHLDNKMVTAWNGSMISGFAKASQILGDAAYTKRALEAVEFVRRFLHDPESGLLYRSCYCGDDGEVCQISPPIHGFAADYAYFIQALIDTYEASFDDHLIEWAGKLQNKMNELFWDNDNGGYFMTRAEDKSLILRIKDDQDGAEPSVNSVATSNLLRLSLLVDDAECSDKVRRIFVAFRQRLQSLPHALPEMIRTLMSSRLPQIQSRSEQL